MELDSVKFRELVNDMVELGCKTILANMGVTSDRISQRQAKTMYKSKLAIWEKRGLIRGDKQGGGNSTIYYSRTALETIEKSEKYD